MAGQLKVVQANERTIRKMRRPKHTFNNVFRPYQVTPFFAAPVLPGETMKNLNWKGRMVSDPLAQNMQSALLPWWIQHFVFYVKLRDLGVSSDVEAMMLQGTPMPQVDAARPLTFHKGGSIDWVGRAYEKIIAEYFRNEGEAWNVAGSVVDNAALVSAFGYGDNFFENLLPGSVSAPVGNNLQNPHDPSVMAAYQEQYDRMRAMRMINMSFEDWLGTYGVKVADPVEADKPELVRYNSTWTYPTNTVEPTTGLPSTAVVYSVDESADKDRFFSEPGFLIGLVCCKAKLYPFAQKSAATYMMDDAFAWLPALMRDEPHTSVVKYVTGDGPFPGIDMGDDALGYWIDRRDLFLHGDHFRNWSPDAAGGNFPALPTVAGEKRWLDLTALRSFFKDSDSSAPHAQYFYYDGIVNLNIAGHTTTATDMT